MPDRARSPETPAEPSHAGRRFARLFCNRPMAALLGLGFASGLPLRLTNTTLQTWMADRRLSPQVIGLLSGVTIPYALKFLWAPLMDRYRPPLPRILGLGTQRSWLLVTQVLLAGAIVLMAWAGSGTAASGPMLLALAALAVATCSASQDVVSDGYRTAVLPPTELGPGSSGYVSGFRLAMIVSGAGALALSGWIPWPAVFLVMAGIAGLGVVATAVAPEPPIPAVPRGLRAAIVEPAIDLYHRRGLALLTLAAFIILFKLPEAIAFNWPIQLLKTLKFSNGEVALVQQFFGFALSIPGALVGGALTQRFGLKKSLWVFGILGAVSNLGFTLLAMKGRHLGLMLTAVGIESFCGGLVAAGFMAFLMAQCSRVYASTQYALFTSLMALSGALLAMPMGYLVAAWGYPRFFLFSVLLGLPGLALLAFLPLTPAPDSVDMQPGTGQSES